MLTIAISTLGAAPAPEQVDLLIRGGTVYTGSAEPFVGDVAVTGDRIRLVTHRADVHAKQVIDASGMVVAPGFIDPHTHAGAMLASDDAQERLILPFLMQGVTTAFVGNDGGGDLDVAGVLGRAAAKPVGINYATYVGLGPIRKSVIGEADRKPTTDELARMKGLVAKAMCEGALGLSTGLFYAPQSFAGREEVVALAREAGSRGGTYDSHIRDESSYSIGLKAAIEEAIDVGRQAQMPVHIAHIKALGVDVQGQANTIIGIVEAARAQGQMVTADQYPWSASGTSLAASLVPRWAQDGGRVALLRRFDDGALADRLRTDMVENLRKRGGAGALLVTAGRHKGATLAKIAEAHSGDAITAAIAVIREDDPGVASFNQSEQDIAAFMKRPWVMTGSDASTGHPRVYGSFARKYAKYVVADKVLTLRDFIERSSALTADTFGLDGRGHLRAGAFADIVVFDPRRYRERATYDAPTLLADGVRSVIVNGVVVVDGGKPIGRAAGRALAHKPTGRCA
ncbi:D-aminoacylase [Sphingomonas cavernae]|uniref:D-aminoacylase n=2 Tax=Sphingomonas cavernae TaxID=2320861 RepID=A0A418WNB7_9SPHN|nr:D-aminoacylase [Sphingomonas cavernae]